MRGGETCLMCFCDKLSVNKAGTYPDKMDVGVSSRVVI